MTARETPFLDRDGNAHDDNGRFVSIRDYFNSLLHEREKQMERIFAERETSAEFKRVALEATVNEAKSTTALALAEQKLVTDQKLADAKRAADGVIAALRHDIEVLQSGGAPFANRLDEGVTKLRTDVDVLNSDAVRTKVLDALREQDAVESRTQKKQIKYIFIAAAASVVLNLVQVAAKGWG